MEIDKLCRCCLDEGISEVYDFTSEFALDDENFLPISDCFTTVLNIELEEDELVYSKICNICLQQLRDAYIFQKKTKDSQDIFKQAVDEMKQLKRDDDVQYLDAYYEQDEMILGGMEEEISQGSMEDQQNVEYIKADLQTIKPETVKMPAVVKLRLKNGVNPDSKRIFNCTVCEKGFNVKSNLLKHIETHSANRPTYECSTCGQICKTPLSLQNHNICFHQPHLKIKCDFEGCEKSFADKSKLRVHQLYHKKEKNFTCTMCKQSYYKSSHLKRHVQNTHFKMRSFKCDYCSSDFVRKETFKTHILNQHKELGLEVQNEVLEQIKQIREPKLDISAYTLERQYGFETTIEESGYPSEIEDEEQEPDTKNVVYEVFSKTDEDYESS